MSKDTLHPLSLESLSVVKHSHSTRLISKSESKPLAESDVAANESGCALSVGLWSESMLCCPYGSTRRSNTDWKVSLIETDWRDEGNTK